MRRGRTLIYLALVVIIAVAVGAFWLWNKTKTSTNLVATPTPGIRQVDIIVAGQHITPGTAITNEMLSSIKIPETALVEGLFTDMNSLVNMYAKMDIPQGVPITSSMVSATAGNVNLPGSYWAPYIPQGLTAVSIPITRLSSAALGIRDGDYVDVIVTVLLADVDPASQSALPNYIAGYTVDQNGNAVITNSDVIQGHFDRDETANLLLYVQPSEKQRPRLVTQMIMQNIQVLHVGNFPLPGEADQLIGSSSGGPTATPGPADQQPVVTVVTKPDIITLMVAPQDAVMLTYLVYSGVEITLTLRNPNDQQWAAQPDAAALEYLLQQYHIDVPAKLTYAIQPRLDVLQQPKMPNDPTPVP